MPGVKRMLNMSDNEEAEPEQESDLERSFDEESSSSSSTDSEDSSDLDEEECERRRGEYQTDLNDLENQFSLLREQLYQERISQVTKKLEEIKVEKSSEYFVPLQELQDALHVRLEVANVIQRLHIQNINNEYESEVLAAKQSLEDRKERLWENLENSLIEKISHLEEDRHSVAITKRVLNVRQLHRINERSRQDSVSPFDYRRKKPVSVSGPYIVYMLKEADILEDWAIIKSASTSKRNMQFTNLGSPHIPDGLSFNGRLV